jgi:hypothetical protein
MSDKELIAQLRNSKGWPTLGNAAADRIEALIKRLKTVLEREAATTAHMFGKLEVLTEQLEAARADAKEAEAYADELEAKNGNLCDLAANEHGRAERAEAKLAVTRPAWKNCAKCRIMGWR